jgi:hypothetical protein
LPCTPEGYYTALRPLTGAAKYAWGPYLIILQPGASGLFAVPGHQVDFPLSLVSQGATRPTTHDGGARRAPQQRQRRA